MLQMVQDHNLPPFGDKQPASPPLKSSCKHTHPPAKNIRANAVYSTLIPKLWASLDLC